MKPNRTRMLVGTVAGTLAIFLLAACTSGGGTPAGSAPAQPKLTVMTPAGTGQVDSVTWNVFEGEPQTIDPFASADYSPNMINSNMCENLLTQTPTFEIKPNLASSFTNPDPLHWVYNLRSDVTFWDGTPMTADDVAWSLNHNMTTPTSLYSYLFSNVASIDVTGTNQVTVTLKAPDYLLNEEFSSFAGVVVEKKFYLDNAATAGSPSTGVMCTGPYKFVKWTQGQSISLTRYDGYWDTALKPKVKNLVFTFLTDSSAITSALISGQIDGAYNVPSSATAQLSNSSVGNYYLGAGPVETTFVYSDLTGAMGNVNMRKALQAAIDWKGLATTVMAGTGSPAKLQTPPSAYGFASTELSAYEKTLPEPASKDIALAKTFFAKVPAAVKRQKVTMVVPAVQEPQQFGLAVENAAKAIGMNFTLKVVPPTGYSGYLYDPKTRAGIDMLYTVYWPNIPNPLDWLANTAVKGAAFDQSNYSGVDALFNQARSTESVSERAKLVVQIEKKLYEQTVPMVPGLLTFNTTWMNKRISGAPASFDYTYYPWAAYLGGTK